MDRKKREKKTFTIDCTWYVEILLWNDPIYAIMHAFLPFHNPHSGHFLQFQKCTEAILCKYLAEALSK